MKIKVEIWDASDNLVSSATEIKEMSLKDIYQFLQGHPKAYFSVGENISYLVDNYFDME